MLLPVVVADFKCGTFYRVIYRGGHVIHNLEVRCVTVCVTTLPILFCLLMYFVFQSFIHLVSPMCPMNLIFDLHV